MADLTLQTIDRSGTTPTFTAAAGGGDRMQAVDRAYLHVKNGGGGSINVTLDSFRQCDQGFDHDIVVAVPAGAERQIALIDHTRFNNGGWVGISYSGVTSVTVASFISK